MTLKYKIYVAVAAALAVVLIAYSTASHVRLGRLGADVESAKQAALSSQQSAINKEIEAAEYKAKIDYLERQLTEIKTIARKQDEELEKLNVNTRGARDNLDRARRTRSITANAAELCAKLAEVGHGCEE